MRAASLLALALAGAAGCAEARAAGPGGAASARSQPVGAISGRVRFAGAIPALEALPIETNQDYCGATKPNTWLRVDSSRGLADAVVYLDLGAGQAPPAGSETVAIDHLQCEITPRIRIVPPGTAIALHNSDAIFHSTRLRVAGTKRLPFGAGLPSAGMPYMVPTTRLFEPDFYELECTFGHPLERGYLIVAAHPWFALTAADGSFVLTGVPPGRYTVKAWHPGWTFAITRPSGLGRFAAREISAAVTVSAGATAVVELTVGAR